MVVGRRESEGNLMAIRTIDEGEEKGGSEVGGREKEVKEHK